MGNRPQHSGYPWTNHAAAPRWGITPHADATMAIGDGPLARLPEMEPAENRAIAINAAADAGFAVRE